MLLTPEMIDMMLDSFIETLIMVGIAGVIGGAIGIPLGILLHVTSPQGILSAKVFNRTIGVLVNAVRSTPFIILLVAIQPLTRLIVGTSIGTSAALVPLTIAAYRLAAERFPYPLHVGVTETGTAYNGIIRSAVGIGTLLSEGIGDTIRVSLTADPAEEVRAGIAILKAAGLRREGVRFVSCPTCGRTQIDLIALAQEVEQRLQGIEREITVAVMGCVVNGPGEAREADYGIAGGKDCGLLFRRGEILGKYPADKLADALVDLILSEK